MSTLTDIYGYPLTTGDVDPAGEVAADALGAAWADVAGGLMGHKVTTRPDLDRVLAAAPDFAFGWGVRGILCMLMACKRLASAAREAHGRASAGMERVGTTRREALVVDALKLLLDDRWRSAADRLDQALYLTPGDAMLAKLTHAVRFMLGDAAGMRRSIEAVLPHYPEDHPHAGYIRGCHAFTLEETGDYAEAERQGRAGLALNGDDCWGLHAVAHVYEMRRQIETGEQWLNDNRAAWSDCNNFKGHVWWHLALYHLEQGDTAKVIELYDRGVRADLTDDYRDVANGVSLLIRLEQHGIETGDRWAELADKAAGRAGEGRLAFADLHYLIALLATDRMHEADIMLARFADLANHASGDNGVVARKVGHPLAQALVASHKGDHARAIELLDPLAADLHRLGGSHAQRDLFMRQMIDIAIEAGSPAKAGRWLDMRMSQKGGADAFSRARLAQIEQLRTGQHGGGLGAMALAH